MPTIEVRTAVRQNTDRSLSKLMEALEAEQAGPASTRGSFKKGWVVAVHVGAGYHSPQNAPKYRKAMSDACQVKQF